MNNPDFKGLFESCLDKIKYGRNGQLTAICPYHNDTKQSFSVDWIKGVWNCKACDVKGNAYQLAKYLNLPRPHQYIVDNSIQIKGNYEDRVPRPQIPPANIEKEFNKFKNNLKNNIEKYPKIWDKELIDDYGIGYCIQSNKIVYGYGNNGYKVHNSYTSKGLSKQWYLNDKIKDFDTKKPLHICEGEKDTITLISHLKQAISISSGCQAIPSDEMMESIKDFKEIIICYDNDKAGRDGGNKLAELIKKTYPYIKVSVIQWNTSLPDKFDVYDSYDDGTGNDFNEAVINAIVLESENKIGGLKLITGLEAINMNVKPTRQIVQNLLPENSQVILGGTTGANKSFMAMQMGMSIANNEKEFLGFKINVNGLKVLYCDTECGENVLVNRFQSLIKHFDWKGGNNFNLITKDSTSSSIYDELEKYMVNLKPDIVIIDCLYNTTEGADISKNHHISPILNRITRLKEIHHCTIIAVSHMNKGGHEQGLVIDRISGGSALQNWSEHIIQLTRTNESNTRLLRIGKSRHIDYPDCYYEIQWDSEKRELINLGVLKNWKELMITNDKKNNWSMILRDLADEFSKEDFKNIVCGNRGNSERTATNWINDMLKCGVIEKVKHGHYKKKLDIRGKE